MNGENELLGIAQQLPVQYIWKDPYSVNDDWPRNNELSLEIISKYNA